MTLFAQPVAEIKRVIAEWGGRLYYDGAHQLGLIGGRQLQDPLAEGADVITGSAGKTFSGPQSGIMVWDDPEIAQALTTAVFPIWAATHQVNRVAALALAVAEAIAYGEAFMAQIVRNARALAAALHACGVPMLGAHKGFADRPGDWDYPGGIRMGTIEVTRLGMAEPEMETIAELIARIVVRGEAPEAMQADARSLRAGFQTLYYCFENGLPPGRG